MDALSPPDVRPSHLRARRLWLAAIAVAGVAAAAVLYCFRPGVVNIYPPCPFHTLTGLHCPGCGTLRALHALLHGKVVTALRLNPLTVLAIPFLAYAFAVQAFAAAAGRPPPVIRRWRWLIWALLGIVLAFWVLRNLPFHPFILLAP